MVSSASLLRRSAVSSGLLLRHLIWRGRQRASICAIPSCNRASSPQYCCLSPAQFRCYLITPTRENHSVIKSRRFVSYPATKENKDDFSSEEAAPKKQPIYIPPTVLGVTDKGDTWNIKMLKWFGRTTGFFSRKNIFARGSLNLYSNLIDQINYVDFFEVCKLPDSLQSWFLVAQLHVWFMMVRLKREQEGQAAIKQVVKLFWEDVRHRMALLGVKQGKAASHTMRELTQQFYGLIIAYEEGLLSDDKVLAAAIWRNFAFDSKETTDPVMLATMVDYIRRQVHYMDTLSTTDLMVYGKITLLPLTVSKTSRQQP